MTLILWVLPSPSWHPEHQEVLGHLEKPQSSLETERAGQEGALPSREPGAGLEASENSPEAQEMRWKSQISAGKGAGGPRQLVGPRKTSGQE